MRAGKTPQGASRLTVRVSRDGGRTYGEAVTVAFAHRQPVRVTGVEELLARDAWSNWPECQCPMHRAGGSRT